MKSHPQQPPQVNPASMGSGNAAISGVSPLAGILSGSMRPRQAVPQMPQPVQQSQNQGGGFGGSALASALMPKTNPGFGGGVGGAGAMNLYGYK